jgi:NAD(P)H-dependent flavin oxidoreductase YrpB (nitropropane dioxygenase family)
MAFVGTTPELAIAVCQAGGIGSIGVGPLSEEVVTQLVSAVRKATEDPFHIDFITPLTKEDQIDACVSAPGAFAGGTNHFAHAGSPADKTRVAEYEAGPYAGFAEQVRKGFASIVPPEADVSAVADAIVKVVNTPFGKRPFRVHIDPTQEVEFG